MYQNNNQIPFSNQAILAGVVAMSKEPATSFCGSCPKCGEDDLFGYPDFLGLQYAVYNRAVQSVNGAVKWSFVRYEQPK